MALPPPLPFNKFDIPTFPLFFFFFFFFFASSIYSSTSFSFSSLTTHGLQGQGTPGFDKGKSITSPIGTFSHTLNYTRGTFSTFLDTSAARGIVTCTTHCWVGQMILCSACGDRKPPADRVKGSGNFVLEIHCLPAQYKALPSSS